MTDELLKSLAARLGTPCYLFDADAFAARVRGVSRALAPGQVCYAMKANPFLLAALPDEAVRVEVCSPGEFELCMAAGLDPARIVLSGVNKEEKDLLRAMQKGVIMYTVESLRQADLLAACARRTGASIRVLVRLSSGNQFGMDEDDVRRVCRSGLPVTGLQLYSGTQKRKPAVFRQELETLEALAARLEAECGISISELEYGPGIGVEYFRPDDGEAQLLEALAGAVRQAARTRRVVCELGRFLAAPCGTYLTQVMDVKTTAGRGWCIVDGGIHHVNYYGQTLGMRIPPVRFLPAAPRPGEPAPWNVCGSLCTAGDVLVKGLSLTDPRPGDLLCFGSIGAYSVTEGMYLFLSRALPLVALYTGQNGAQVVRPALSTAFLNSAFSKKGESYKMDELLELLQDAKPDIDFLSETALIDDGLLDSFDVVNLIYEISEKFGVEIPPEDVVPEHFNSVQAMWEMIQDLQEE